MRALLSQSNGVTNDHKQPGISNSTVSRIQSQKKLLFLDTHTSILIDHLLKTTAP
jgi:hypothetical protein